MQRWLRKVGRLGLIVVAMLLVACEKNVSPDLIERNEQEKEVSTQADASDNK